jgi:hypothetical protein
MLKNVDVHRNPRELITHITILYEYKNLPFLTDQSSSVAGGFIASPNGKHILKETSR